MYASAALDFRWVCCRWLAGMSPERKKVRPLDGWHHAIETLLGAAAFGFCSIKGRCEETTPPVVNGRRLYAKQLVASWIET